MMFTVELYDEGFAPVLLGPDLALTPERPAASAIGGCTEAEIVVRGGQDALTDLANWLRWSVIVRNELGSAVWWGYVHEVAFPWRGVEIGLTLGGMANRVAVGYTGTAPGVAERSTTAWAEDADSVARYGKRELLYTRGDLSDEAALRLRDDLLARRARPLGVPARPSTRAEGRLYCRGWWQALSAFYYTNEEGLIEFWPSGTKFGVGVGFTATTIGFEANNDAIHDLGDRFAYFDANRSVRVAGSASNNGLYTITRSTSQEPSTITSTAIAFQSADNVTTTVDSLFDEIDANDLIKISGAATPGNNRWSFVDAVTDGGKKIDLRGGGIVDAAAGPAITIERAISIQVEGALITETPGASVTLTLEGMKIAQRVRNPVNVDWPVSEVWLNASRIGTPVDNLVVDWCADSAGALGSVLYSTGVTQALVSEEGSAVRFALASPPTLASGAYAWIVVRRSGANSATDAYQVEIAESGGYSDGTLQLWDGAQWNANPGTLLFSLRSQRSTTAQIADIIGRADWVAGVDIVDESGVLTYRYTASRAALAVVEDLLNERAADGQRLLATVDEQRYVRLYKAPVADGNALIIGERGALADALGTPLESGELPVGQWAAVGDLPPDLAAIPGLSPVFLERAAYDARSGLRWEPFDEDGREAGQG